MSTNFLPFVCCQNVIACPVSILHCILPWEPGEKSCHSCSPTLYIFFYPHGVLLQIYLSSVPLPCLSLILFPCTELSVLHSTHFWSSVLHLPTACTTSASPDCNIGICTSSFTLSRLSAFINHAGYLACSLIQLPLSYVFVHVSTHQLEYKAHLLYPVLVA